MVSQGRFELLSGQSRLGVYFSLYISVGYSPQLLQIKLYQTLNVNGQPSHFAERCPVMRQVRQSRSFSVPTTIQNNLQIRIRVMRTELGRLDQTHQSGRMLATL